MASDLLLYTFIYTARLMDNKRHGTSKSDQFRAIQNDNFKVVFFHAKISAILLIYAFHVLRLRDMYIIILLYTYYNLFYFTFWKLSPTKWKWFQIFKKFELSFYIVKCSMQRYIRLEAVEVTPRGFHRKRAHTRSEANVGVTFFDMKRPAPIFIRHQKKKHSITCHEIFSFWRMSILPISWIIF